MTYPGSRIQQWVRGRHRVSAAKGVWRLPASKRLIPLVGMVGALLLAPSLVFGQLDLFGQGAGAGGGQWGKGWSAFRDLPFLIEISTALLMAAALGAIVAYHPKTYGKAATLEEVDQPKIFIMYAVVGSIVGVIVGAYPEMAIVIFGIGGLLRFRTDVGAARDTGRVILVTLVGISCGLKVYVVAVLATVFGWILIYLLESRVTHRVVVKGISQPLLAQASEAYHEVLLENGFAVMSQKKNFLKGQVAFVFRASGGLNREQLEGLFKDIPPKLQGAPDWEST